MNNTIPFGNITTPVVDTLSKTDLYLDGGLTLSIHIIIFIIIVKAYYNKYNEFLRGLVVAGFITGILSALLTVFGYLSWKLIYMSISCFVIAFLSLYLERKG